MDWKVCVWERRAFRVVRNVEGKLLDWTCKWWESFQIGPKSVWGKLQERTDKCVLERFYKGTSGEQDFKTDKHTFVPLNFLIYRTIDASMIKLL